jgi:LemA protein
MNRKWLVPGIIIGVIVLFAMTIIGGYNGLVGQRENVNNTFGNLQSQYQRRADLVPNLVNTVKGASNFEQETLTQVTEARAKATSITIDPSTATPQQLAQYQQSQGELSQALGRLLAVTENYPELKAVAAFQDLQVQLEGTENRIAVARQDYNGVVTTYNTTISRFPTNITAAIFGFDRFETFKADQGAENAPTVDFNS